MVGAGAAGLFAALRAKELEPRLRLLVLERGPKPLRKVELSGGGRCNVTHSCHDMDLLLRSYPRGGHRLESILSRFMPQDTVQWFRSRGVRLKTESDGRMFPVSNSSKTIVDCLLKQAHKLGIEVRCRARVDEIERRERCFLLRVGDNKLRTRKLLLATGGGSKATGWLRQMGHETEPDIPSLFTFCIEEPLLKGLAGLSVDPAAVALHLESDFEAEGPLLVTHWGVSGPAVLKLSAFAARELYRLEYKATLHIDLVPGLGEERLLLLLGEQDPRKQVSARSPFPGIPKRLWQRLVERSDIGQKQRWERLKPVSVRRLAGNLKKLELAVAGKGQFKDEFVTSGGLPLHEIDVYTMESRRVPGLFVAGELLNVDGVTGGFNFQNAWASGFVAGEGLASK